MPTITDQQFTDLWAQVKAIRAKHTEAMTGSPTGCSSKVAEADALADDLENAMRTICPPCEPDDPQ